MKRYIFDETSPEIDLLEAVIGGKNNELTCKLISQNGIKKVVTMTASELKNAGLTDAQATKIKAIEEIARRINEHELNQNEKLTSVSSVVVHFTPLLRDKKKEFFYSVLLDTKHRIIRKDLVSVGSLNISVVHPREVFVSAIRESANSILLVHNHPSGDPTPSQEDIELTARLKEVGRIVGIFVVDHVVIGDRSYVSFAEKGMI